jgi:hypothetical protein
MFLYFAPHALPSFLTLQDAFLLFLKALLHLSPSCHCFLVYSIHSYRLKFPPPPSSAPSTSVVPSLLHHLLFLFVLLSVWETRSDSSFVPLHFVSWMKKQLSRGKWHVFICHKCVFVYLRTGSIFCLDLLLRTVTGTIHHLQRLSQYSYMLQVWQTTLIVFGSCRIRKSAQEPPILTKRFHDFLSLARQLLQQCLR